MKYIVTTPSVETTVFKLILLMCRGYELLMFFSSICFFAFIVCLWPYCEGGSTFEFPKLVSRSWGKGFYWKCNFILISMQFSSSPTYFVTFPLCSHLGKRKY